MTDDDGSPLTAVLLNSSLCRSIVAAKFRSNSDLIAYVVLKIALVVFGFAQLSCSSPEARKACRLDPDLNTAVLANNRRYAFIPEGNILGAAASDECDSRTDSSLLSIHSESDLVHIRSLVNCIWIRAIDYPEFLWIGLRCSSSSSLLEWVDGSPVDYGISNTSCDTEEWGTDLGYLRIDWSGEGYLNGTVFEAPYYSWGLEYHYPDHYGFHCVCVFHVEPLSISPVFVGLCGALNALSFAFDIAAISSLVISGLCAGGLEREPVERNFEWVSGWVVLGKNIVFRIVIIILAICQCVSPFEVLYGHFLTYKYLILAVATGEIALDFCPICCLEAWLAGAAAKENRKVVGQQNDIDPIAEEDDDDNTITDTLFGYAGELEEFLSECLVFAPFLFPSDFVDDRIDAILLIVLQVIQIDNFIWEVVKLLFGNVGRKISCCTWLNCVPPMVFRILRILQILFLAWSALVVFLVSVSIETAQGDMAGILLGVATISLFLISKLLSGEEIGRDCIEAAPIGCANGTGRVTVDLFVLFSLFLTLFYTAYREDMSMGQVEGILEKAGLGIALCYFVAIYSLVCAFAVVPYCIAVGCKWIKD